MPHEREPNTLFLSSLPHCMRTCEHGIHKNCCQTYSCTVRMLPNQRVWRFPLGAHRCSHDDYDQGLSVTTEANSFPPSMADFVHKPADIHEQRRLPEVKTSKNRANCVHLLGLFHCLDRHPDNLGLAHGYWRRTIGRCR